ncbi:MAG: heat-inducible transcriptional repressor HrcA [Erysipelotrichaceae bacterium]
MLSVRQQMIFKTIVEEFIETAEPVGSKTLMEKYILPYSSATIRNEMGYLEDLGLLEKTHASSGRVPSTIGYQYYVEHYLNNDVDSDVEYQLSSLFDNKMMDVNEAIRKSCDILSHMTNLTSMILGPDASKQRIEYIKIFPLTDTSAVAVFITDLGHTENRTFKFNDNVSVSDLQTCTQILNERLKGTLVCDVTSKMESIKPLLAKSVHRYEELYKAFFNAFVRFASENMYASGQSNMLYQPEFSDIEKLREMMTMLENGDLLGKMQNDNALTISTDSKIDLTWVDDMAIVSSRFNVSDNEHGEMYIVGPSRMHYDKIISLMEYMSKMLESMYGKR